MTLYLAAAIVAPAAKRTQIEAAIAILTPTFTVALTMPVCAIGPGVTWQTPATHYYTNGASIDQDIVAVWQAAALGALPPAFELPPEATMTEQDILDALTGVPVWSGANVTDAGAWAAANLTPEGLMLVPPNNDV